MAARLATLPAHRPQGSAKICAIKTQPAAAELLNVSRRAVQSARAVQAQGVPELVGADPAAWVVSKNLHRRHLSESQRAMVAARLATLPRGANQHRQICLSRTQLEAAELLNVAARSVKSARAAQTPGVPELVDAVDSGARAARGQPSGHA